MISRSLMSGPAKKRRKKKRIDTAKISGNRGAYTLFTRHMWAMHGDRWRAKDMRIIEAIRTKIAPAWRALCETDMNHWKEKAGQESLKN
jgi:hypothetical protein